MRPPALMMALGQRSLTAAAPAPGTVEAPMMSPKITPLAAAFSTLPGERSYNVALDDLEHEGSATTASARCDGGRAPLAALL